MKTLIAVAIPIVLVLGIWGLGITVASYARDYEVIEPELGVKCVVVSRMFNTSVDCWRAE